MKKIFLVSALVLPFLIASCDKDNIGATFSGEENLATFAQAKINDNSVKDTAVEYNVPVRRQTNNGEYKIAVTANTFSGKIKVSQTEVTFADGEYEALFKLNISDTKVGEIDTVALKINVVSDKVSTSIDSCTVILAKAYTFETLGNGEFCDNFVEIGPLDVEIQKAVGFEVYRALNPYPDEALKAAGYESSGAFGYGGDECEYIQFTIAEDGSVSWKNWSTRIDYTGNGDTIYAYYLPKAKATGSVIDENVIYFNPYWYIPSLGGGFGTGYPVFLTLPGGPDLEEWLSE